MTTTSAKFTVGQIVKHITSGRREKTIVPATVTKVWKNGVVQIADYATGRAYTSTFAADGTIRGSSSWHHSYRIEPLTDGETAESLLAENEAKALASRDAADQAKREKQQRITDWWNAEGKAMWDARIRLPEFLGEEVFAIRFTRHGEAYMPFVIVRREQAYDGERIALTVGGLTGGTYEVSEGGTRKSISTYSSSGASGATLEEALYEVTH